jgi:nucleoid-associated protein YgaU
MDTLEQSLKKAKILILPQDVKPDNRMPSEFNVQFNPTEFTRQKSAQIAEIAVYGIDSPILQFVRGQNEKMTLDLFFDTTEDGMGPGAVSVTTKTDPFYQLVKMQPATHAPPRIQFVWGDLTFQAIVESVQERFTLFNPDGIPLRATLSLSLREYKDLETQLKELKLQSVDHTKQHVVKRGETLSKIAGEEYGDATLWRAIADKNPQVDSPRKLTPGMILNIPPLEELRRSLV